MKEETKWLITKFIYTLIFFTGVFSFLTYLFGVEKLGSVKFFIVDLIAAIIGTTFFFNFDKVKRRIKK